MFTTASIALISTLSLSPFLRVASAAPVDFIFKFCTGVAPNVVCQPLNDNGQKCTNIRGVTDLVMPIDAECIVSPQPDCNQNVLAGEAARSIFTDTLKDLDGTKFPIASVICFRTPGTANGITVGTTFDVDQGFRDVLKGIEIPLD
ncbi:hypothetical protein R3P38DRAFT_2790673 [Favolaschia claudopus]|uniref:Uncharacterized protein n=1 Tax=Favolaschia claudopus TaxID=2862362 RepID=A0AAW0AI21_9AGAR